MKKLIIALLFIVSVISVTGVKGETLGSPFTEFYTFYPRFRYITDTDGNYRAFFMFFEQDEDTGDTTYKIDIEQLDNNGNVINLLASKYINPEDPLTTGVYNDYAFYDWSDNSVKDILDDNGIVFYRVVYNNSIVMHTGGVMVRPDNMVNDSSTVEFGDYVYNTGGLVDPTDQAQFTYNLNNENIIPLHYRFNEDVIEQGIYNYIRIRDLSTMTTEYTINSVSILTLQGGADINYRNSFIPLFITGSYPDWLRPDLANYDYTDNLSYDLGLGSYLIYMEGNTAQYIQDSEATALLNISNLDKAFNLIINYDSIVLTKKQKLTFLKDNEESNSVYETIVALDLASLYDYSSDVNTNDNFSVAYSILDTLEVGATVGVNWQLEPITLPFSIPTSNYIISDTGTYEVAGESNLGDSITTTIDWFGWNNTIGLLFVSVAIIVLINIIMIAQNLLIMPLLIINGAVLGLLSFMGFLPIWLIIGEFLILILGFGIKTLKGGN